MTEPWQLGLTGARWLEEGRLDPGGCCLGMKLINYVLDMGIPREDMIQRLDSTLWEPTDDWNFPRAVSLSYVVVTADPHCNPLGQETPWSRAIPMDHRQRFLQSLSDTQMRSLELLRDWWDSSYQDSKLGSAVRSFIRGVAGTTIDSINPDSFHSESSLYQQSMFDLWALEFNPVYWRQGSYATLPTVRRSAYDHGLTQKAGFLLLQSLRPDNTTKEFLSRQSNKRLPASFNICPWLPETSGNNNDTNNLPLYLWDTESDQTMPVTDLLEKHREIEYTCISHTWGRWKKKPESFVPVHGVNWAIPENTIFDVMALPFILRQARARAKLTRFIWFDLVCLPQDTSKPEYLSEVSRQATIFRHASGCVAWMNTLTTWTNLRASLSWICLYYLYAGQRSDVYQVHSLLEAAKNIQSPIELLIGESEYTHWLTSTWTLQESCLCPDMILCTKDWQPLEIVEGLPISLHQLLTIHSACSLVSDKIDMEDWPAPVLQLGAISPMVCGRESEVTRLSILSAGVTRQCERRRADAIMSAMGMTDWYDDYFAQHKRPPPDVELVMGAYPLAFVAEVAKKMGAEFFSDFNLDDMRPEARGTLLPFKEPGSHSNGVSNVALGGYRPPGDYCDHPCLRTWSINTDGSVDIPEASVLRPGNAPVELVITEATADSFIDNTYDLDEFLRRAPPGVERLALALTKDGKLKGVMLQSKSMENGVTAGWVKFATWTTSALYRSDFPPVEQLNIKVL